MKYLLSILLSLLGWSLWAQTKAPTYFIEEDVVVFEFDGRDFARLAKDSFSLVQDFSDFDIQNIIDSGQYSEWSENDWTIVRKNENTFQLRKNLDDFQGDFAPSSKYMIDGQYWHSPTSEPEEGAVSSEFGYPEDPFWSHQEKFKITNQGNQTFFLQGFLEAKQVILSGSFNSWNEKEIFMEKTSDGWQLTLDMAPGIYEYKFIIDGMWIPDPTNTLKVINPHKTFNSILLIGEDVIFTLPGYNEAKKVTLSGSFNNWSDNAIEMTKTTRGWACDIPLPPGKHYYKFIVDGQWITDPTNELMQRDDSGGLNSVLLIH